MSSECQSEIESALKLYWGVVGFSLGLTVLNILGVRICLRRRLEARPTLAAKIFFAMGAIKILLGILILSVFQPVCPSTCVCYGTLPGPLYGCIVLVIGSLWLLRGYKYLKVSREVTDVDEEDEEEKGVGRPTSEIEAFTGVATKANGGETEKESATSTSEMV